MANWKNWAETVKYKQLEKEFEPRNRKDLVRCVKQATDKGWKLRAVGAGHAWSNLGVPSRCKGAIIDMHRLNKRLKIDKQAMVVEVEGGTSTQRARVSMRASSPEIRRQSPLPTR